MKIGEKENRICGDDLDRISLPCKGESGLIDFLSDSGRRWVIMLEAYLDESGTHAGAPVLCMAGYVGNRKQWLTFEREWLSKIKNLEVSSFHAEDSSCDRLRLPLAEAIDKAKFKMGIICSAKPDIFNAYASKQLKSQMGNAYAVCAVTCAWVICEWAYANKLGAVSFAYETGQPNADFVDRALKTLQRHNDQEVNIASVAMVKKSECIHLATADFLSHVVGTKSYDKDSDAWYNYLIRNRNILYTEISADKLNEMSKIIKHHFIDEHNWKKLKRIQDKYALQKVE